MEARRGAVGTGYEGTGDIGHRRGTEYAVDEDAREWAGWGFFCLRWLRDYQETYIPALWPEGTSTATISVGAISALFPV